jgi:CxxC motif-containing protein (DUF1111 family)
MSGRIRRSTQWPVCTRWALVVAVLIGTFVWLGTAGLRAADGGPSRKDQRVLGRELFEREWLPGDSRAHGGDGLGPVYNDSSCIACHNLGASGGGGPASKNVDIITASPNGIQDSQQIFVDPGSNKPGFLGEALGSLVGLDRSDGSKPTVAGATAQARRRPDTRELIKTHPGFRTARSVVLHRFGTEPAYESWRQTMLGFGAGTPSGVAVATFSMTEAQNAVNMSRFATQSSVGEFVLVRSQRNPTPLFGAGLIDTIPDRVLEDAAKVKHLGFPEIAGRVSRLKDKRIGRFGWKAQTPTLQDFVLTACAVELGLEVPGHHQGGVPQKPDTKARGLDLSTDECNALVDYVRALPKPVERRPPAKSDAHEIDAGRKLFVSVGCATCHTPRLGDVDGIYSDLLVHDLGQQLGDTGQYSVFDPSSSEEEIRDEELGPIADAAGAATATAPAGTPAEVSVVTVAPGGAATAAAPDSTTAIKRPTTGPASRFEWRTPPLWGFRDSGPYLHDGRADTLDQAVALHGGEAANITVRFFSLSGRERRQVEAFLKSMTAPSPEAPERVASVR